MKFVGMFFFIAGAVYCGKQIDAGKYGDAASIALFTLATLVGLALGAFE